MLCYFERRPALRDFKSEISNLKLIAESCSRQLRAWADSLQNSEIEGPRHLNERSREEWRKRQNEKQSRQSFENMMREGIAKMPKDHPARMEWERKNGPLD
jgi:chromosome segregation ATPase